MVDSFSTYSGHSCVLLRANTKRATYPVLTREELVEVKNAYDVGRNQLNHSNNNLASFFGLHQQKQQAPSTSHVGLLPNPIRSWLLVYEYGAKGSLRTVLANDNLTFDNDMFFSLLSDLVLVRTVRRQDEYNFSDFFPTSSFSYVSFSIPSESKRWGLTLVHKHFSAHGRLLSSFCTIDARFSLKIYGYGVPSLLDMRSSWKLSEPTDMLYCAPELLRLLLYLDNTANPLAENNNNNNIDQAAALSKINMRACDMYALGIIVSEMANRAPPFNVTAVSDGKQTVDKLLHAIARDDEEFEKPTRPNLTTTGSIELTTLVQRAWHSNPVLRPTAVQFRDSLTQIMSSVGISSNIFENLLRRMEKYALDLEDIVRERTEAMLEEKKRAETLLYNILPRTVADELKMGRTVMPEAFASVTIYFSDVVGFTRLSATSTPFQVVDLLNDLYTLFDETIAAFDVYKVETIGDAYMVVSGLPIRNGNEHSRQVARLSLALLEAMTNKFHVKHQPEHKLQLRIGVHTGACAAGVVGFVMPRYCLFGDTVNTASRMESTGEPLKIHASENFHSALTLNFQDEFRFGFRGEISVKGKGDMKTFWLVGTNN